MEFISHSTQETLNFGKELGPKLKSGSVISLRGSLGSGKTIIAKGIAEYLNINEAIVSPTFTILQEYEGDKSLYHMDLYRISGCDEFELMGGEEMLYGDGITLIEWSEKIDEMLPEDTIYIDLTIEENQDRIINVKGLED
ncbi:MAG: tRNA (adenosine(37)-N6)-threonylcarbamoyltransferase complex ATPase subunit type 1 TsaE [Spirochaetaceae bacterium]|nr:tRNA (adenosine(37)-N6)-threonylcarbamoyltransferase complex ATPase subunit type 1 TsaE [Spirochaetaceae bacterium]